MSLKEDYAARTRRRLLEAGRAIFSQKGFGAASTGEIARQAGATRGALYHHFDGKDELFRALFEAMEEDLLERVGEAIADEETFEGRLKRGIESFLDQCLDPDVQRIVLLEAPAVLGWEQWRDIDEKYAHGLIREFLRDGMDEGKIEEQPVEPLTQLVMGALTQAAMALARSSEPERDRERMASSLIRLIEGLQP